MKLRNIPSTLWREQKIHLLFIVIMITLYFLSDEWTWLPLSKDTYRIAGTLIGGYMWGVFFTRHPFE